MRICWGQYALWAVIITLALLSLLSGCGASGDLYLPSEETKQLHLDYNNK
ncbi:MAG: lipoprotein [Thiohalomonadaceae bacterium]